MSPLGLQLGVSILLNFTTALDVSQNIGATHCQLKLYLFAL